MAIELHEGEVINVSGGANPMQHPTYKFNCTICGHKWEKESADPSKEHGCPKCGWWFESHAAMNRPDKWEHECVKYDPNPIKK